MLRVWDKSPSSCNLAPSCVKIDKRIDDHMKDINEAGDDSDVSLQVKMSLPVLLTFLLIFPFTAGKFRFLFQSIH